MINPYYVNHANKLLVAFGRVRMKIYKHRESCPNFSTFGIDEEYNYCRYCTPTLAMIERMLLDELDFELQDDCTIVRLRGDDE